MTESVVGQAHVVELGLLAHGRPRVRLRAPGAVSGAAAAAAAADLATLRRRRDLDPRLTVTARCRGSTSEGRPIK